MHEGAPGTIIRHSEKYEGHSLCIIIRAVEEFEVKGAKGGYLSADRNIHQQSMHSSVSGDAAQIKSGPGYKSQKAECVCFTSAMISSARLVAVGLVGRLSFSMGRGHPAIIDRVDATSAPRRLMV
jgi:hypothetical protein